VASTLFIGDKNYSSWSMRPLLVLRAFGIKFTEKLIPFDGFSESSHFKQSLAKYSPAGKAPFLQCSNSASPQADPLIIWETLAIIEYLAEQNPQLEIWPRNVALRAQARSFCTEMQSCFLRCADIAQRILTQICPRLAD